MNALVAKNSFRFIFLILLQGLVLMSITLDYSYFSYMNIIVYPLAIMLLPVRTPKTLIIFLSFALGILLDFFYNSPGVHAATCVFMGFIRPYILSWIEPRGGYSVDSTPTMRQFGFKWVFIYTCIFMGLHLFLLFSIQQFTFVYIGRIFIKTVMSFSVSVIFIMVYLLIFNPEE
ncbi:MAG TPA: rod shape-determining protein MreD [Saprospiraceae bacterium]|nr:rod shape-determining protein MreD [Saprospiraceae bacterium]HQW55497.1 rod shape-determining protein MreD [Saprospiraceae bacterium]